MEKEKILNYLSKNPLLYIGIIEVIKRNTAEIIEFSKDGLLILEKESMAYMMVSESPQSAKNLIKNIEKPLLFAAYEDYVPEIIEHIFSISPSRTCLQAAYFKDAPPSWEKDIDIRNIDESCLDFISAHYNDGENSKEYVKSRLASGAVYGAFIDNHIAGFIGTHEEGAIGMLDILKEYRRMGIGQKLLGFMTDKFLSEKKIPFSQIMAGNEASYQLHKKLDYEISKESMIWFES